MVQLIFQQIRCQLLVKCQRFCRIFTPERKLSLVSIFSQKSCCLCVSLLSMNKSIYWIWTVLILFTRYLFFRYKIDFISAESAFLFNIKFSACFETKGDCMLNILILKDVKIPILACNFSLQQFAIPSNF